MPFSSNSVRELAPKSFGGGGMSPDLSSPIAVASIMPFNGSELSRIAAGVQDNMNATNPAITNTLSGSTSSFLNFSTARL